ncbi:MAG: hypothetical protein U0228_22760 [Myxococcaceae bacterium]
MRFLFAVLLVTVGCSSPTPPPLDGGETIDSGTMEPPPDAGIMVRNLGTDVPVSIDFILPFAGGLLAEDWAVSAAGDVVLAGQLSGVVDLDPTSGVDQVDLGVQVVPAVIVLDQDGKYRWGRGWKDRRGGPQPVRVAVGPTGDVYVMSTVTSGPPDPLFDLDPTAGARLVDTRSVRALFVAHLSADGAFLGGFVTTGDGIVDTPGTITAGPDGRVWLTGWFQGLVDLDPSSSYLMLNSGGTVPNLRRKQFVARYESDLRVIWGFIPSTRSIGLISPFDGGALFAGTYGGGVDFASVYDADLDQGPGLDVHSPGCLIRGGTADCLPASYFGKMNDLAELEWSVTYNTVTRNRTESVPTPTSGGPIARPNGEGLVLGVTRDTVDFDWTSVELVYSAPWHASDVYFDVFAQGVSPDGTPLGLTRTRTLRLIDGLNEATWTNGTWSAPEDSFFATGWTQGSVIFPSIGVAGVGRPAESFLASFDPRGQLRWATGLGVPNALGGGGAARVLSSSAGRTFVLGSAPPFTDLDFTPGLFFADAGAPYLVGFHVTPCIEGSVRECTCLLQVPQGVTARCSGGQYESCACSQENLRTDGTIPPRPTPDCGTCAAGWTCNPATWLCEDAQQQTVVAGLNHPTAVADDGSAVYYSVQGRYPRTTPPPSQLAVGEVWRISHDGGVPEQLTDGGPVSGLQLFGGSVYWAQQGLWRAPSADGGAERIVSDPLLKAPLTFFQGDAYWVKGNQVMRQPLDGGAAATSGVIASINEIRGVAVDPVHVYALTEGANFGGLYRLAHTAFGGGGWQRQAVASDPRAMVQLGSGVFFSDFRAPDTVTRFDTISQQTSTAVGGLGGEVNTLFTDGSSVYFTRWGLPTARTWTGEVWRIEPNGATPTLLASSIQHAAGAFVRGTRLLFAEHGETRASTTTGRIGSVEIR